MDKITGIYGDIVDFENLYLASQSAQKDKRYRRDVLEFNAHLEENIIQIQNELIWKEYKVGEYRERYIYEPKKRLIMALPYRDRVVQWAVYRQVMPIIDKTFYRHSYACRPEMGSYACIEALQTLLRAVKGKGWYYGKFDISKFFHRVDHQVVMWDLSNRIDDEDLLWLYDRIINSSDTPFGLPEGMSADKCAKADRLFEVGMPIGNLSSQTGGNMYLDNLDRYITRDLRYTDDEALTMAAEARAKEVAGIDKTQSRLDANILLGMCDGAYIRYMDDGIIIGKSKKDIWRDLEAIRIYSKEVLRLDLNSKTMVGRCDNGVDWLGCHVDADEIRIKRQNRNRMIKKLNFRRQQFADGKISKDKLDETENSYRARLKKLGCDGLLKRLNL
ncbi:MAG: reverse transcriptase domain-containing protein [Eubacterium aggregans]|uniref:reverse transcriptase domain-containing protein n=1 Tax=Eubacterium aggregans TaxID=81409 RepID=UPI002B1F4291|nr:reverse transcriptase domain-containing protein [Eubacterium aggregans]MEA5073107.1 reverse transcriptase domain-containing protein [Eubacterium aggregans]